MSTHVIIDHRIKDYRDAEATVARLGETVPAARAIGEYWPGVGSKSSATEPEKWRPARHHTVDLGSYLGPGGLLLSFGEHVVVVCASASWTGFLTIEPLRSIHLAAFRSIAKCVGGTRLVLLPDESNICYEALRKEGLSQEQCIARLREDYGPPQRSVSAIPPGAFAKRSPGADLIWFNEAL
jgi:hypothetical protein